MFWEWCFGNNFEFCVENSAQFQNLKYNFMNVFYFQRFWKTDIDSSLNDFYHKFCFVFAIQICTSTKKSLNDFLRIKSKVLIACNQHVFKSTLQKKLKLFGNMQIKAENWFASEKRFLCSIFLVCKLLSEVQLKHQVATGLGVLQSQGRFWKTLMSS